MKLSIKIKLLLRCSNCTKVQIMLVRLFVAGSINDQQEECALCIVTAFYVSAS